ncbi:MAG TPA: ATP-binding protein [Actinomycetota bacterium]|nr:ATP-binding protein [Actinomycetota bacterium]
MEAGTVALLLVAGALAVVVGFLYARLRRAEAAPAPPAPRAETGKRTQRVEDVLERISEGVVFLDDQMQPVLANSSARSLLGLDGQGFALRATSDEVMAVAKEAHTNFEDVERTVETWFPTRRHLDVRGTPMPDRSGTILIIDDITEALRTQRIRTEFVAHASHELKSPVASLQALAEAVRQAVQDDPDAADRFSKQLVKEAVRLGRLIGDLLDLSRLEEPAKVSKERVDMSVVGQREGELALESAAAKDIELNMSISPHVLVSGDEQQLSLMLRNLLDNAIRYTPEEGHVALDIRPEGDEAVVRVIDTGMGIPMAAQERVFERFYRVDKARSRDRGGTGLGLAIVKHAVELHGGTIGLESELERGSTFTVRLPIAPAEPLQSAAG